MRALILLCFILFATTAVFSEISPDQFKARFGYDLLREDRVKVVFANEVYWLRSAVLRDSVVRLTFFKKGDTPTTYTEALVLLRSYGDQTVEGFSGAFLEGVSKKLARSPDIIDSTSHSPTDQRVINVYTRDEANNVFENNIVQLRKNPSEEFLDVAMHIKRLRLDTLAKDPDLANRDIGSRAGDWISALDALTFPY